MAKNPSELFRLHETRRACDSLMLTGEWIEKKVSESKIVENSFFVIDNFNTEKFLKFLDFEKHLPLCN